MVRHLLPIQSCVPADVGFFRPCLGSDTAFPRLLMIGDLFAALNGYPSLSRAASTAIGHVGESIKDNATNEEIAALLDGALTEDAFVRLAAVQALQPLDLTELEFPANLWVLTHDVDERNRELAFTVWAENGLSVPETFLPFLLPLLSEFQTRAIFMRC